LHFEPLLTPVEAASFLRIHQKTAIRLAPGPTGHSVNEIPVETPAATPFPFLSQQSIHRTPDHTRKPSNPQPKRRKFFRKAATKAKITPTTGSTARNGDSVQRRRYQCGSVRLNKSKTLWIGEYAEYVLDAHGLENRIRQQIVLSPVKTQDKTIGKREAQRLLQPYVDRVNVALAEPVRERKSATFEAFAEIWERDYLSLSKPATQSGARSILKRLKAAFGRKDMRAIDAGDIQRFIAERVSEGLAPKTIRNHWGVVSLIWNAALAQRYVDAPSSETETAPRTQEEGPFLHALGGGTHHCRV
jgi:integrase-like protein